MYILVKGGRTPRFSMSKYLRFREVNKTALLLSEVLRGPLLVLTVALVLEHLNLIGAAEIIAATGRDVWHGSLATRHHSSLHGTSSAASHHSRTQHDTTA